MIEKMTCCSDKCENEETYTSSSGRGVPSAPRAVTTAVAAGKIDGSLSPAKNRMIRFGLLRLTINATLSS